MILLLNLSPVYICKEPMKNQQFLHSNGCVRLRALPRKFSIFYVGAQLHSRAQRNKNKKTSKIS